MFGCLTLRPSSFFSGSALAHPIGHNLNIHPAVYFNEWKKKWDFCTHYKIIFSPWLERQHPPLYVFSVSLVGSYLLLSTNRAVCCRWGLASSGGRSWGVVLFVVPGVLLLQVA